VATPLALLSGLVPTLTPELVMWMLGPRGGSLGTPAGLAGLSMARCASSLALASTEGHRGSPSVVAAST